jgi:hypothetical protein
MARRLEMELGALGGKFGVFVDDHAVLLNDISRRDDRNLNQKPEPRT